MFLDLYYPNGARRREGEQRILPYAVLIPAREKRAELENLLRAAGFQCVVEENGYPCMYVNMALKRLGRSVKACSSGCVNGTPMTLEAFLRDIWPDAGR